MATAAQERTKKARAVVGLAFTIAREQLIDGLARVASAIPSKPTLPILGNVLLEATDRGITLTGTDLDEAVTTTIAADVEGTGKIALPARRLMAIAKELPPAPVRVRAAKTASVVLDCGRANFRLFGQDADEFPALPRVEWNAGSVSGEQLADMVRKTTFAASSEDSRPIINGILWQREADVVRMVATSGHLLALVERKASDAFGEFADAIVPKKPLEQAAKLFGVNTEVEIGRGDNHLGFRDETSSILTRLIEGPYPPYPQVIPKDTTREVLIDRVSFMSALRRAIPMASDESHRLALDVAEGQIKLHAQTADVGEVHDELAVRINGAAIRIGFNARYLLDVLSVIDGDEVTMKIKAADKAVIFEPAATAAPKSLYIVMPMRLLD